MASYFMTGPEKIRELMKVALGEIAADIAIINGDLVNVYTGEVQKDIDKRIVSRTYFLSVKPAGCRHIIVRFVKGIICYI